MEYEIKPQNKFSLSLNELWEYRELFYYFTWRDIKVKYKQTLLGFLWAILQPLIMAFLFYLVLGKTMNVNPGTEVPYFIFVLSGLVIWGIFSSGLNNAGNSMVTHANIIKKIYFPRLIIPLSSILGSLFDFIMAFVIFIVCAIFMKIPFSWMAVIYIPLAIGLAGMATFGAGSLLAALNVKYRDFRYIIPFLIQFLFFATPVVYSSSLITNKYLQVIFALNPMTAPIHLFRAAFMHNQIITVYDGLSILSSLFFLLTGLFYFRKTESYFADLA